MKNLFLKSIVAVSILALSGAASAEITGLESDAVTAGAPENSGNTNSNQATTPTPGSVMLFATSGVLAMRRRRVEIETSS